MKKKIYAKRALKMAALFAAIVLTLQISQEYILAHFDSNSTRVGGFYLEQENSLDVVLIGASDLYSGFSSGLAYDEFGFTSYPLATGSNPISLYKSELKEVLKRQSPQMIVVEINGALYKKDKMMEKEANLRKIIDNMPMSQNKIDAINETIPKDKRSEYFFPIIKYHGAWNDILDQYKWIASKAVIQQRGYCLLKGNNLDAKAKKPRKSTMKNLSNDNSLSELAPKSEAYLRGFLQYCKDENISNIVFTRFPHRVDQKTYERFQRTNRAGEIIKEYGFDFINFEKDYSMTGIDTDTDFANDEHLNVYGQQKMTKYFGKVLQDTYGVKKRNLSGKLKEEWDKSADYNRRFYELIKQKTDEKSGKVFGEDIYTINDLDNR